MSRAPADINSAHTPELYKCTHNFVRLALSEAHCAEHATMMIGVQENKIIKICSYLSSEALLFSSTVHGSCW